MAYITISAVMRYRLWLGCMGRDDIIEVQESIDSMRRGPDAKLMFRGHWNQLTTELTSVRNRILMLL